MKLKRISIVPLKEKTSELQHNQDKYIFCFYFFFYVYVFKNPLNAFYVSSLYIFYFWIYHFLEGTTMEIKLCQLFCAIPVTIDFLIVFHNSLTILSIIFLVYLYNNEINLLTYLPTNFSENNF